MDDEIPSGWAWAVVGVAGVGVGGYLLYKYFVYPGNVILNQYKKILEDIYKETKQFLKENKRQGVYGLTENQKKILATKEESANDLRPQVEKVIYRRGWTLWSWVETAVIGIIGIYALKELIPVLSDLVKDWRAQNPDASTNIASQYGHSHLIYEIVANEFAYMGELDVASAFYNNNIPSIYSSYTGPAINTQISYYQNLIPTLPPGTIAYYVAQQMLNYLTYEISTVTGIMPILHSWWIPPL